MAIIRGLCWEPCVLCHIWIAILLMIRDCVLVNSVCQFPAFLQTPLPTGSQRYWLTELKYLENTDKWSSQLEVWVHQSIIEAKIKFEAHCSDYRGGQVPCEHKETAYRRICIREEGGGKYRIKHSENRYTYFTCLKIIQRNKNVVQVWTVPVQEEWSSCPLPGGYDVSLHDGHGQRLCPDVWQLSRLESECVRGDGLTLTFPEHACSPFNDLRTEAVLQCWASWQEDIYTFIIAGQVNKLPQFVFRMTDDYGARTERPNSTYAGMMYFSPVISMSRKEPFSAKHDVFYVKLKLTRTDAGMCYDESDQCRQLARSGKCSDSALLYQYANYCKKSCGMCKFVPSTQPECVFPNSYQGNWLLFEKQWRESVSIEEGYLTFSSMGEFICKSKHWEKLNYKLLSHYTNGCRPRYTCVHLDSQRDGTLQMQISRSSLNDESFSLCKFGPDPLPFGDTLHSATPKTLLYADKAQSDTCALTSLLRVQTFPDHNSRSCSGTLSDWDPYRCGVSPHLTLTLEGPCAAVRFNKLVLEHVCTSYISLSGGYSLLLTRANTVPEQYTCWVIRTNSESAFYQSWIEVYILDSAQCGSTQDLDPVWLRRNAQLALKVKSTENKTPCLQKEYDIADGVHSPSANSQFDSKSDEQQDRKNVKQKHERHTEHIQNSAAFLNHFFSVSLSCVLWTLNCVIK